MYNSFLFKKHNEKSQKKQQQIKKRQKYQYKYHNQIRPILVQRYGRRVNNFIVKLEQDKNELYEYRQETQRKALQLLKEIQIKERFLGRPSMKMKDGTDWNSNSTAYDRFQKEKNKTLFESKFGDQHIAYRSIASQSDYYPKNKSAFRSRQKQKEIHSCNMRFTNRFFISSSPNKPQKEKFRLKFQKKHHTMNKNRDEELNNQNLSKSNKSNKSHTSEEESGLDHANSFNRLTTDLIKHLYKDGQDDQHYKKEQKNYEFTNKNNKIYFKQVIDIYQNTKQKKAKKQLQQLLVRFGVNRIKDLKKQAMVQTDKLEDNLF